MLEPLRHASSGLALEAYKGTQAPLATVAAWLVDVAGIVHKTLQVVLAWTGLYSGSIPEADTNVPHTRQPLPLPYAVFPKILFFKSSLPYSH